MSSPTVRASITARLLAFIGSQGWDVPLIDIENRRAEPDPTKDWIAVEFLSADEQQITTGAPGQNTFREIGDFFIHYVTATGKGSAVVLSRLDDIRDHFRFTEVDDIEINAVSPPNSTSSASLANARGAWWGSSILTQYQYDLRA